MRPTAVPPVGGDGRARFRRWTVLSTYWLAVAVVVHTTGAGFAILDGAGAVAELLWLAAYGVATVLLLDGVLRLRLSVPSPGPALVFLAMAAASVLWSEAPAVSAFAAFQLAGTVVIAVLLAQRLTPVEVLDATRVAMIIVAMASLVLYVLGEPRVLDPTHGTLRGVLVAKNSLGQVMAIGLVVTALAAVLDPTQWVRRAVTALPMALALALSDSASGLVVAVLGVAVVSALRLHLAHRLIVPALFCAVLSATVFGLTAGDDVQTSDVAGAVGRDTTLTGRTEIWPEGLEAVAAKPLLGYGYGAFWNDTATASDIRVRLTFQVAHAHNGLLDVALEAGALGIAAAMVVLGSLVHAGRRDLRFGRADVAALRLGVVVLAAALNTVETGLLNETNAVTVLIVVALAAPRTPRRTPQKQGPPRPAFLHDGVR